MAGSSSPKSLSTLLEPTVTDRREVKGREPNRIKEDEKHGENLTRCKKISNVLEIYRERVSEKFLTGWKKISLR